MKSDKLDIKDTIGFYALKCMVDCVFWYNRLKQLDFDFNDVGRYANLTDDLIIKHKDKLFEYIKAAPIVLEINTGTYASISSRSDCNTFNNHNGITTYRCLGNGGSIMSVPNYLRAGYVIAIAREDYYDVQNSADYSVGVGLSSIADHIFYATENL